MLLRAIIMEPDQATGALHVNKVFEREIPSKELFLRQVKRELAREAPGSCLLIHVEDPYSERVVHSKYWLADPAYKG